MNRLGDIAEIRAGHAFRTRVEPDPTGETYVLQMKDVDAEGPADVNGAIRAAVTVPKAHHLAIGDVVLKGRGTTQCAVIQSLPLDQPLVAAAPILVLRPKPGTVEPAFLRWLLNHPVTQARLATSAAGTYIPTLTKSAIEEFEVAVPPLETQRLITNVATLAERERQLLEAIILKRKNATDQLLLGLCRPSGNQRK